MKVTKLAVALAAAGFATGAYATNGMNLEGYGPIAAGMGGASYAYDNGTAATMNNPATLALMAEGSRLDIAVGGLHPDINLSSMGGLYDEDSKSTAFYMPAIGYAKRSGKLTYGVGLFAQGGMGAEYQPGLGAQYSAGGASMAYYQGAGMTPIGDADLAAEVAGLTERSEVGVGRLIFPVAFNASEKFTVGGSLDFVWAMMDLKMAMPGAQFAQMMDGPNPLITGTMVQGMTANMMAPYALQDGVTQYAASGLMPVGPGQYAALTNVYGGYFDFSDDSDFTGKAKGYGFAGKIGFTYKPTNTVTIGGVYHSRTALGDMTTSGASMSMAVAMDVYADMNENGVYDSGEQVASPDGSMSLTGKIKIKDFQWPETYGLGIAWQATDALLLAADVKRIGWSKVMKNFKMQFTADNTAANGAFAGATLDAVMPQNWDDQTVIALGLGYKVNNQLTLRAGYNHASNPIPTSTLNYLFPATVETHYTVGLGYAFNPASELNFSYTYVPSKKTAMADGSMVDHSQDAWQLMYSQRF